MNFLTAVTSLHTLKSLYASIRTYVYSKMQVIWIFLRQSALYTRWSPCMLLYVHTCIVKCKLYEFSYDSQFFTHTEVLVCSFQLLQIWSLGYAYVLHFFMKSLYLCMYVCVCVYVVVCDMWNMSLVWCVCVCMRLCVTCWYMSLVHKERVCVCVCIYIYIYI